MSCTRGFTLLELIVAVSVASILLTIGLPSFNATMRQNCTVSGANGLLSKLTLARSEAITRGKTISLCKSSEGSTCSRSRKDDWSGGFVMFVDDNHDGSLGAGEKVIKAESSLSTCGSITANKFGDYISFNGEGVANSNGSFFVKANAAPEVNRTVSVFRGRIRVCNAQTDKSCSVTPE